MPELPEVEVSCLGIRPHLAGQMLRHVVVRQRQLRWPVPDEVMALKDEPIQAVSRRAKYLLIELAEGSVLLHLGMSGHLKVLPQGTPAGKHDHVDFVLGSGQLLRLNDTRRFGAVLWQSVGEAHALLSQLGPEPLTEAFNTELLWQQCQKRGSAMKLVLMDNKVVVGVGNIYANEALFKAGILPTRPAKSLSVTECERLVQEVKQTLAQAIAQGGTTLRDFSQSDGKPGYFKQELLVYGRGAQPCVRCGELLQEIRLGQRSTVFCQSCQL
ncbi:bifunctional DNA-formamidopyrimidine glycosylase/DNA-(apurinic or apyrimidinic site) lyase [Alkalimonas sp.]|uniref:bifunctional DNA-formamidopyrimidine glycosylase/DNA-(apurinic or apyrimidinic site) lyase n=1 Tax=Alkalimonas sp. TaxID=1872453 RepID=UPI00263A666C|nr:bifunctional DNA-formamidopyrimidine glycosylase/DNA-(apurinic or apyrimidinic site) lyase [Alkalimonas sp.]MCC5827037.1 bifunctional DNA-formamidopyrimidine glycosylase/DNA-(apurinic or apyrimidinic site) lyase [Alkalimonas sp.]